MTDSVATSELRWDLRTPCGECPFRTDVAFHEGVAADIMELHSSLERGTFAHSCHRTDPRSDYEPAKNFTGHVQHCAGALIMMRKSNYVSGPMGRAIALGDLKLKRLNMRAPVYPSFKAMVIAYARWLGNRAKKASKINF